MRVMHLPLVVIAVLGGSVGAPPIAAAGGWTSPVDGSLLRAFSVGPNRFAAGQHRGIDLAAPAGARVLSACGGRVSFAGVVPRGGRTVSVRCGRLVATYQHLGAVAVRRGQAVAPRAPIGTVGRAPPHPHVHLGARDAATGRYVDPLALIGAAPRGVPPLAPGARRPLVGLGPAPRARRPLPRAERPRPLRVPLTRPLTRPPPLAAPDRLPWPVWLGLALFGLGLPLGGAAVTVRRRHRRARASAAAHAQVA